MFFVKALLEITRIKLSKKMETGIFSLRKTAENAVSFVEARARDKNIKLTWTVAPGVEEITGAQVYIEETIANFLANSIKYTPEGGSVDLMVGDAGASVLIRVSDTGIGIPKDDLPHIFEEFYRAKNAKAVEKTGTGLGLAIAKEVAERHNGSIWVESKEGKGSRFYFSLPKQAAAWPAAG
jgi:signal transduction histidine kinase